MLQSNPSDRAKKREQDALDLWSEYLATFGEDLAITLWAIIPTLARGELRKEE